MDTKLESVEGFMEKVKKFKEEGNALDLSSKEDLGIGIMNLISLEEHFQFSYEKTRDEKFLELLKNVRGMRKDLLAKVVTDPKGEVWCISKHLLAASMRLSEVGTKALGQGNDGEAKDYFDKAYSLWNLFWGMNLGLLDLKDAVSSGSETMDAPVLPVRPETKDADSDPKAPAHQVGLFGKLGAVIEDIMNCCRE
ncbi:MAG TPA: hypothetical protein VN420_01445 [Candidatus Fimivivens sp.]|nr:hypothetical protein [Candidatus Fimivivens sp.]